MAQPAEKAAPARPLPVMPAPAKTAPLSMPLPLVGTEAAMPMMPAAENGDVAVAIDPVCGMEVEIEGARYTTELNGQMYYFCCAGCKRRFEAEPTKYLKA